MNEPELSREEIKEMRRRLARAYRFFTGDQVHAHLHALQVEWDRTGGFDETYMHSYLKALDAREPANYRTSDGKWVILMPEEQDAASTPAQPPNRSGNLEP